MMNYEEFTKRETQLESASAEQRKAFYAGILQTETDKTDVRMMAYFRYALLCYREGDFRTAREILEPFIIDYQSYRYRPEIIACFNLMGVASYCENEYALARFYIDEGLKVATTHKETSRYAYEYNNMAVTYLAQRDYDKALAAIRRAEKNLPESDVAMHAYVYKNMSEICCRLGRTAEAEEAFHKCTEQYHARDVMTEDVPVLGLLLYSRLKNPEKYAQYRTELWNSLPTMHAADFASAAQAIFDCAMDNGETEQAEKILTAMDDYVQRFPQETQIGMQAAAAHYDYAKARNDRDGMLAAMEQKEVYYKQQLAHSEELRVQDIDRYLGIGQRLQAALEREAEANRAKTRFLANMSHDIRTPINGIMGMLSIIETCRDDKARMDDCLSKIDLSAQHLLSLVNDVLDMTKLESGAFELEHKPFNLDKVCAEMDKIIVFQAEEQGLHVTEEHENLHYLNVKGSELHFKKILLNLFSNCIKYNKPGGSIYTRMREVSHTQDIVTYEFMIRDTGIGMTQDFIDHHLFEAFVQADTAARSRYDGTGLGMSIVGQLVEKLHGTIKVESKLGEGSCFTVVLPFEIDHDPPAARAEEDAAPADLTGKRLLLVEDNELNMEIAEFMLKSTGAEVEKAADGQQAVQAYTAAAPGHYDAILMDLMMPVMDGYAATRAIRSSGRADAAAVPIIAMSANAYAEDVKECLDAGMNAHISKPLFKNAMLRTIARFV